MKLLSILLALTVSASAGEYAVLASGQRIHADRHEIDGDMVRLLTQTGSSIEFKASQITTFEQEEYVPPPPAAPAPAIASLPVAAAPAHPLSPEEMITLAAQKAGLPPEFVHSIAKAESGYHTNALSPKGAIGLMQLMPQTAASLKVDPYDPRQNAEGGAEYLAQLLERYRDDAHQVSKAVAAYNAGPGAVDKYNGIPPYRETVNYVNRVLADYTKRTAKKQSEASPAAPAATN